MRLKRFYAILFIGISIAAGSDLKANNGSIAYVYPVSNIIIDGNLDDWPVGIEKHKLTNIFYGNGIDGEQDALIYWRGGYDAKAGYLYIGTTMQDNDYVKTPDNPHYSSHDFQVLYLDPIHSSAGSGVIAYEVDEHHPKIVEQEKLSFYPQVRDAGFDQVEYAIKRSGSMVTYEWKIKIAGPLDPGRVIGFDYAVFDKDTDEDHVMITWGPSEGNKFMNSNLIGDLVIMDENVEMNMVNGTLAWEGTEGNKWHSTVVFSDSKNSETFYSAGIDSLGHYSLLLPDGKYHVTIPESWKMNKWFDIDLIQGGSQKIIIELSNNQTTNLDPILVTKVPKPNLIPKKGILRSPLTKASVTKINEFVEAYRDYYNIPAVSLALIQDSALVFHKSYGVENSKTKTPLRKEAVFEAASITKLVFAYMVNRLVQREEFDLDKPLHESIPFPELEDYPEYKLMTGRHILTHVSGLPNWGTSLRNKPGTTYGYSGEGFEYLKRVIASKSTEDLSHSIQSYLEKEILHPFGMVNTYFMCNDKLPELKVAGHIDGIPNMFDCPEQPGMAFSMHTEAKDFASFALALLKRDGLTKEQAKKMFDYHTILPEEDWMDGYKAGFGLGVSLRDSPYGLVFGHGGNNGDFRCAFEMYDELGTGYIMFTNANTAGPLLHDLIRFLVEGSE